MRSRQKGQLKKALNDTIGYIYSFAELLIEALLLAKQIRIFFTDEKYGYDQYEMCISLLRSYTLSGHDKLGAVLSRLPLISELLNTTANTYIYRSFHISGRRISLINQKLDTDGISARIVKLMTDFKSLLIQLSRGNVFISARDARPNDESRALFANARINYGVMKRSGNYIHNVMSHASSSTLATVDISKFFDSMTLLKMMDKALFLNAFKININYEALKYISRRYEHSWQEIEEMLNVLNSMYLTLIPFFLHNGKIPTGMVYSTHLSNYLFSPIDKKIENKLRGISKNGIFVRHTRYIDDITISSNHATNDSGYVINIDLIKDIEQIVNEFGFYLKYEKTRIYGVNDTKIVHGVSFGGITNQAKSINSDEKYAFAKEIENLGISKSPLSLSIIGKLNAIDSVNPYQYAYCLSHYFMHTKFVHMANVGTYEYRLHIQNEIIFRGAFYDIHVKPVLGRK